MRDQNAKTSDGPDYSIFPVGAMLSGGGAPFFFPNSLRSQFSDLLLLLQYNKAKPLAAALDLQKLLKKPQFGSISQFIPLLLARLLWFVALALKRSIRPAFAFPRRGVESPRPPSDGILIITIPENIKQKRKKL
jgi:hypothetical protein